MNCPLFVISAYEHRWTAQEVKKAGATDFMPKPFSIAEIERLLTKYVKRKR